MKTSGEKQKKLQIQNKRKHKRTPTRHSKGLRNPIKRGRRSASRSGPPSHDGHVPGRLFNGKISPLGGDEQSEPRKEVSLESRQGWLELVRGADHTSDTDMGEEKHGSKCRASFSRSKGVTLIRTLSSSETSGMTFSLFTYGRFEGTKLRGTPLAV